MAHAQSQFESFHDEILLSFDTNAKLRERREALLKDLKDNIDEDAHGYSHFIQGSYALHTGVTPLPDNDPDMDVGLIFDCSPEDYPDSLTLKKIVRKALERPNRTVKIRRPCVTVTYLKDGKVTHHIDLAIYTLNADSQTQLAKSRETDAVEDRIWEASEARELIKKIADRFEGDDRKQFRRVVRALKRWRDIKLGHANAPSVGLTVAAYNWFSARYDNVDGRPRDLLAIRDLLNELLSNWSWSRLEVHLPVAPNTDLFEKMTEAQASDLKQRLKGLRDSLSEALDQPDTHEACKVLKKQFGNDFPVPPKSDTTKEVFAGVSLTGRSA
ncbi:cyclic GMP-AMP synthase DncV-like nucleotidyltransferase [uncultured Microbulbifer sp.]|uniref:cyclic GMP-AMP synthase DncV-like nucleotidyltransferase n=1 Tax=uncultured Microbulbifer sp. TaxID=348147 RepID=UPI00261E87F4|nr:nucleotidyltransferase [uncultured Microbulbifer sp.]